MKRGFVVYSKAGRDKDNLMVVAAVENAFVFVCDGKIHRLERPKRKNPKHLVYTGRILSEDAFRGNKALKNALRGIEKMNSERGIYNV